MVSAICQEIKQLLSQHNVVVEVEPQTMGMPGMWLMRGDPDLSRKTELKSFEPHPGQDGTWGVFFADNLTSLTYPNPGIYWIFYSQNVTDQWVIYPSPFFDELIKHFATIGGNDLSTYGGYVEAQRHLFETYPVYDVNRGIATVNYPVDPRIATLGVVAVNSQFEIFQVSG